jgi:hypothetical protein
MNAKLLTILGLLAMVGFAFGAEALACDGCGCKPAPEDPEKEVTEKVSNNDDAFDDLHDTYNIDLTNNDDAFDDLHDTYNIDLTNNDDAFDDLHDTWQIEGRA